VLFHLNNVKISRSHRFSYGAIGSTYLWSGAHTVEWRPQPLPFNPTHTQGTMTEKGERGHSKALHDVSGES
jgi:hypothetical protein